MNTETEKPKRHVNITGGRMGFIITLIETYSGQFGAITYTHGEGWGVRIWEMMVPIERRLRR